jgi:quercetin dioxygenase-like cupin family protein
VLTSFGRTARTVATLVVLAGVVLTAAGCAQPGQLGHDAPADPPPAAAPVVATQTAPPPAAAAATGDVGRGTLPTRIQLSTLGPAEVSVRTVELAPGETTGWHRHPGTETTIVDTGEVTVQTADDCTATRYRQGQALFVPDAEPHLLRNDGTGPARLVVTQILAPGAPDRSSVASPCAGAAR